VGDPLEPRILRGSANQAAIRNAAGNMPKKPATMKTSEARAVWATLVLSLVTGCASPPQLRARPDLLHDEWFHYVAGQKGRIISPGAVLTLSAETASALDKVLLQTRNVSERIDLLVDTIYGPRRREFDYRSAVTTPAEQTFRQRAGNCLSLSLMTIALADKFGLYAQLQEVPMVPVWERQGQFDLISGHVFVIVRRTGFRDAGIMDVSGDLVIDFDPAIRRAYRGRVSSFPILRERGLAMFYNNRGAEAYVAGRLGEAFANYRQAVGLDAGFYGTWFNLSQLYLRIDQPGAAEAVLKHALEIDPQRYSGLQAMQNLLGKQGRDGEAALYAQRIARLRDSDPYYHYMIGAGKFSSGDLRGAIGSFERATSLGIGFVEVHEALRDAYRATGDIEKARMQEDRLVELARTRHAGDELPSPEEVGK
jgi:tetratricopeptide (TPR) repeat protein